MRITEGNGDLLLGTRDGWAIRFREENVRPMGRTARGVRGIKLREDSDQVVGMAVVPRERPATLLTVCERGYGKRTPTSDYPTKNRGGKGVITIKTTERNGKVVGLRIVTDDDDLMLITDGGKLIRMPVDGIPTIGRNTQGVRLIRLEEGEKVVAMERLAEKEEGEHEVSPEVAAARAEAADPGRGGPGRRGRRRGRGRRGRRATRAKAEDDEGGERRHARRLELDRMTHDRTRERSEALFERGAAAVPRRGQLAGAGLQGGGRHAGVPRPRAGRLRLGRRRQPLPRLHGVVGAADPGPRRPRRAGGHPRRGRRRHHLRRLDRAGDRPRRGAARRDALDGADAAGVVGHRGDHVGAAAGPRVHRARQDRQGRGRPTTATPTCCWSRPARARPPWASPARPASPRRRWPTPCWSPGTTRRPCAPRCEANRGEVAAVIIEPVPGNMGLVPPPPGYLQALRELCDEHGALLIFDEVITGFRVGAAARRGSTGSGPTSPAWARSPAAGLPLGVYGGRADIMAQVAPEGPVYQAGTLSGNPLAVAAGLATLRKLTPAAVPAAGRRWASGWKRGCRRGDGARRPARAASSGWDRPSPCSSPPSR